MDKKLKICAKGESICIPANYSKFDLPNEDELTQVSVGIDIKDIPNINDHEFSVTLNAFFVVRWVSECLVQCDQMARSFAQNLAIYSNENGPMATFYAKVCSNFAKNKIKLKFLPKTSKILPDSEIWPNLVTLVPTKLSGFVWAYHPAVPGSSPKHTMCTFSIYLYYILMT